MSKKCYELKILFYLTIFRSLYTNAPWKVSILSFQSTAKNYREAISVLIRENEESKTEIAQLEEQLETENNTLREAKTRLEGVCLSNSRQIWAVFSRI
jgi:hypothetical protein